MNSIIRLLTPVFLLGAITAQGQDTTVSSTNYNIFDHILFTPNPDGETCTLTSTIPIPETIDWTIPERVKIKSGSTEKEYTVTAIGPNAFKYFSNFNTLTVPPTVTTIGEGAFQYSGIHNIRVQGALTTIEPYTFKNSYLKSLILPPTITTIGDEAFYDCYQMHDVVINDGITSIGKYAFYNCGNTKLHVPSSLQSLGEGAFQSCKVTEPILIPATLTDWTAQGTFSKIHGYGSVAVAEGITAIPDATFIFAEIDTLYIPKSVAHFGDAAFDNGYINTYVTYNPTPLKVNDGVFTPQRIARSTLLVPKGSAGAYMSAPVWECFGTIAEYDPTPEVDGFILKYNESNTGVSIIGTTTQFEGALTIPSMITIPNADGTSTPLEVTSVAEGALKGQDKITSLTVETAGLYESAFAGCIALETVTFGPNVTTLSYKVFEGCSAIREVTVLRHPLPPSTQSNCFDATVYENAVLKIHESAEKNLPGNGLSNFRNIEFLKDNWTHDGIVYAAVEGDNVEVADGTGCKGDVTIPDKVTLYVNYMEHEYNVIAIGNNAFMGNEAIVSVSLPASVRTVGEFAFQGCTALKSAQLPGVESLDRGAFYGCSVLESVATGDSLTSIWVQAFFNCRSLSGINLPKSLEFLELGAFAGCTSLSDIQLPHRLTYIGAMAFRNCTSIKELTIPYGIKDINQFAFSGCTSLTTVHIAASVVNISRQAFAADDAITYIECTGIEPATLDETAFTTNVYNNAYLQVPVGNSTALYRAAEGWKNFHTIGHDVPTGIDSIESDNTVPNPEIFYDLSGRPIATPTRPGLYIVVKNGKPTKQIITSPR